MKHAPFIAAIASYVAAFFALQMVVAKAYGIWWEVVLLPAEIAGAIAIGWIFGTIRALKEAGS